ncbi:hypothetical protein [Micromonospora sp. KC213]|uniref:hypothetical protein n=1 Tax=Micromonospora sp. KC213 TaxID=2530378 RepID=UPI001A9F56EE|nr:hypothetical protein [Micromonospora sp. KC213]
MTASAQVRCVGGRAYVAVQASSSIREQPQPVSDNRHTAPVGTTPGTVHGTRTFTGVAPGANAYQSFATRTHPAISCRG